MSKLDEYKAKKIKTLSKKRFVVLTKRDIDNINVQVNKTSVDDVVRIINYKASKIKMLTEEFLIKLTDKDIENISSQESEMWIDSVAHNIIMDRL